jgi:DNA-binding transcriptional LysR family regulator
MLDVTRLRVLVAVARHGSVTAAARALNYAQPSVSHHIARLEAETGTQLIERVGRGIRLTEAGRLLAERAEEIIGRLDSAETELAAHVGQRQGRVRLAAFPSALGTLIPAAAARLVAEVPGLEFMLTEAEPPEALRMLRAGYVDVAVVFQHYQEDIDAAPPQPADEGTRGVLLLDEPVHLVTPAAAAGGSTADGPAATGPARGGPTAGGPARGGPTAGGLTRGGPTATGLTPGSPTFGEPVPVADLTAYAASKWIAGCERCRSYLVRQCESAGFTPRIAFTTDDYLAVQALVAAGLGVTTLPGLCLRAARHPGILTAPLAGARRHVFAVTYGRSPGSKATARLIETLQQVAGEPAAAARLAALAAAIRPQSSTTPQSSTEPQSETTIRSWWSGRPSTDRAAAA